MKLFVIAVFVCICSTKVLARYPILLVPGYISSQLYANFTATPPGWFCGHKGERKILWIDPTYFVPGLIKCMVRALELRFDPANGTTHDQSFVKIDVPGFGLVDNVEYLTRWKFPFSSYFAEIVKTMTTKMGYKVNQDIRAAPYDFRKGLNELDPFMERVKGLVEHMSADSQGRPVFLLGHSMGNILIKRFLSAHTDASWRQRYIRSWISVAAPFGGSVEATLAILSGSFGNHVYPIPKWFQPDTSTWPASFQLLPKPSVWPNKSSIVMTPSANYSTATFEKMFHMSGISNAVRLYQLTRKYDADLLTSPGVKVHCIYSYGIPTFEGLDYRHTPSPWQPTKYKPTIIKGAGDGTVNLVSLQQCYRQWVSQSPPGTITQHNISGIKHFQIVKDQQFLDLLVKLVST